MLSAAFRNISYRVEPLTPNGIKSSNPFYKDYELVFLSCSELLYSKVHRELEKKVLTHKYTSAGIQNNRKIRPKTHQIRLKHQLAPNVLFTRPD